MPDVTKISKRGRGLLLTQTCDIKRSMGSASGYPSPSLVHDDLACSHVYEMSDEEIERGGLTTISRPCRAFVTLPSSGTVKQHDTLTSNGAVYAVHKAKLWPHQNAKYYELVLDYLR